MVGVAKSSQGRGIGKALVKYAVNRAAGGEVALSTMNPRNIKLYQQLGFVLKPEKQTEAKDCKHRPGFTTYHMVYKA
jgi:ribosomal protein S18 acetylase RimI-like enzyme